MAKQVASQEAKPGLIRQARTFLEEVRTELTKVTWPTRDDLRASTKVTMYLLCIMAAIMFVFDFVFAKGVMLLLSSVS